MNLHRFLREFHPIKPPRLIMRDGRWISVWTSWYDGAEPEGDGPWEVLATSCGPMGVGDLDSLIASHGGPDWSKIPAPSPATLKGILRHLKPAQFQPEFMRLLGLNITSYHSVRARSDGSIYIVAQTTKTVCPVVLAYRVDVLAPILPMSDVLETFDCIADAIEILSHR